MYISPAQSSDFHDRTHRDALAHALGDHAGGHRALEVGGHLVRELEHVDFGVGQVGLVIVGQVGDDDRVQRAAGTWI